MKQGRRRHERLPAKDGDVSHQIYKCVDISESGMKFSSEKAVRIGFKFEITLLALKKPLPLTCEVVWCREPSSVYEHGYYFGTRFIDISITSQLRIRELIQRRLESESS